MELAAVTGAAVVVMACAARSGEVHRTLPCRKRLQAVLKRLQQVAGHDWQNSHPLDLSDEGLLADLQKNEPDVAEMLALQDRKGNAGEHGHHGRHGDTGHDGHDHRSQH